MTSIASTWCCAVSLRIGRSQDGSSGCRPRASSGVRKSDTTTRRPRLRCVRAIGSSAAARSLRCASSSPLNGSASSAAQQPVAARAARTAPATAAVPVAQHEAAEPVAHPEGQEPDRGDGGDRQVTLLQVATYRSPSTPDRSTSAHVSSSRSAITSRTCGIVVRAVTAQSIRRTSSSPGYVDARLGQLGARTGQQAEVLAVQEALEPPDDGQLQSPQRASERAAASSSCEIGGSHELRPVRDAGRPVRIADRRAPERSRGYSGP